MIEYMNTMKKKNIISSLLLIILSIILIAKPIGFMKTIIIIIGVLLTVDGLFDIIGYFMESKETKPYNFGLFEGIIELIAGIFFITKSEVLLNVIPIIIGIIIVFKNIFKIQLSLNLRNMKSKGWGYLLLISILTFILGIVIILNPFSSIKTLVIVSGIILLISEMLSLICTIYFFNKLKD